jgi:hypothetical protein
MSSSLDLSRLYQWATMTPVNLLASLVLAVIGFVVLFYVLLGVLLLIGSVLERLTPEPPSALSASREAPVQGWWFWIACYGALVLGMMVLFKVTGWWRSGR